MIFDRISRRLGDSAPSLPTVGYWIREFKRGRKSIKDAQRSGRPSDSVTPENVSRVEQLIKSDQWITFSELTEMSGLCRGTVQNICEK